MKTKPKPLTEEDLPAPGSVFLFPLEDGQYSIARVARRITRVNPTTSTPKRQKVNATVLAIFLVPTFFVVVSRLFGHGKDDEGDQNVNNYEPLRDDGDDGDAGRDRGPTPQGA